MRWPHVVVITKAAPAAGVQDPDTGAWTPALGAEPDVLYNGLGDLQHDRRTVRRATDTDPAIVSDADVYLQDESDLWAIPEGAYISVIIDDLIQLDGRVVSVDLLSGMIMVNQLTPVS
jgi:hypothetical protein